MKRILLALSAALLLSGCAAELAKFRQAFTVVTTATVDAKTAQVAVSSFEVVEQATTEYFKYCKTERGASICAAGTAANPGPLRIVIKYDRQGRKARDQIKAAGKSGALISSTLYNLLTDAVTNLSASPASSFGVAK